MEATSMTSKSIRFILAFCTFASSIGMALWAGIQFNDKFILEAGSKAGKKLLRQYQGTISDIFFIALVIALVVLIYKIYQAKKKESIAKVDENHQYARKKESLVLFAKEHPFLCFVMAAYTGAMISGTTHLYQDLIGWYPDLMDNDLLNNFSIRSSFISETMRRSYLRMFPLAHQDLHILSWFTIHIKVWMLFTAAQLFAIAILTSRLVERINHRFPSKIPGLLQLITILLLFQPSTGNTFFHVIFCERTLTLLLLLYCHCLIEHEQTGSRSSYLKATLFAILGIFTKDIGIILFMAPPATTQVIKFVQGKKLSGSSRVLSTSLSNCLLSLIAVFVTAFIFIALIPSAFTNSEIYSDPRSFTVNADWRVYLFLILAGYKIYLSTTQSRPLDLIDKLNGGAVLYAIALASFALFDSSEYLSFPVHVIILINIGWLWSELVSKDKLRVSTTNLNYFAVGISSLVILVEQVIVKPSFIEVVSRMKWRQASTQKTYEALKPILRDIRQSGKEVNIIISRSSRLSFHRHMNQFTYDRLIEYYPKTDTYWIKDGVNRGKKYIPQKGDVVANIDKGYETIAPILEGKLHNTIYQFKPTKESGMIVLITGKKPEKQ